MLKNPELFRNFCSLLLGGIFFWGPLMWILISQPWWDGIFLFLFSEDECETPSVCTICNLTWAVKKNLVICLYLGDDKLPSYVGIFFISQYMDPHEPTSNSMECHQGFVSRCSLGYNFSIPPLSEALSLHKAWLFETRRPFLPVVFPILLGDPGTTEHFSLKQKAGGAFPQRKNRPKRCNLCRAHKM